MVGKSSRISFLSRVLIYFQKVINVSSGQYSNPLLFLTTSDMLTCIYVYCRSSLNIQILLQKFEKQKYNRRYAHFITRTKNDQLSVDGAKLDGNLKAEVLYKSMGSKCGSSNNSPLELRTGHLACHTLLSVQKKCMASEMACP